jgi:hypothetical protein
MLFFRQKLSEKSAKKPFQLSLFSPDDGTYEYFVLYTNKTLTAENVLNFYNGRCAMEHQISEIKGEFGFDAVPTNHYQANTAQQHISAFAYNIVRNFQIDSQLVEKRRKTRKRTNILRFESLKTLRFEWIAIAGRILKLSFGRTLRISNNLAVSKKYQQMLTALDCWAA